ncbi:MAG: hypothetical protein DMF65_08985 [Acidobacteria bacterium]|nr:MAG: hypothetical protein DMF65_08985 [Acidobacteriota bacterium]
MFVTEGREVWQGRPYTTTVGASQWQRTSRKRMSAAQISRAALILFRDALEIGEVLTDSQRRARRTG